MRALVQRAPLIEADQSTGAQNWLLALCVHRLHGLPAHEYRRKGYLSESASMRPIKSHPFLGSKRDKLNRKVNGELETKGGAD